MSEYTKGPWRAHFDVPAAVIEGHIIKCDYGAETPIASLWVGGGTHGKPRQIANARLMAAAPELLEACKSALSELNTVIAAHSDDDHPVIASHAKAADLCEAAIKKAEGRP